MDKSEALSSQELNVLSETFRLLGDPNRPTILLRYMDGPKPVTDGSRTLDQPQSGDSMRPARRCSSLRLPDTVTLTYQDGHRLQEEALP